MSFESPEYTADVDGLGTLRILEAIRLLGLEKKTRISLGLQDCLFLGNLDARRDKLCADAGFFVCAYRE